MSGLANYDYFTYLNRNVMILPRLKYFELPAATIQASVCQPLCLTISQTQQVRSENIFATWIKYSRMTRYFYI